jgi:hypothetical protein
MEAQSGADSVNASRSARERQARMDARQAASDSASNAAARAIPEILRPSEVDPATVRAVDDATSEAGDLAPVATAVNQGRQTRDGLELRVEMRLRDLITRHPNNAADIVEVFRENGLISPLMREYAEASEDIRDSEEFYRETEQAEELYAAEKLGNSSNGSVN